MPCGNNGTIIARSMWQGLVKLMTKLRSRGTEQTVPETQFRHQTGIVDAVYTVQ